MRRLASAALVLAATGLGGASLVAQMPAREADASRVLDRAREIYSTEGPREAQPEFERALQLFRAAGDELGEAVTLGELGNCYKRFGELDRALELLEQALATKRRLGDRLEEARTLNHLGLVHWEGGDYDRAIGRLESSIALARQAGDGETEGKAHNNLGLVYDELGDYGRSLQQYERALELYAAIDFPRGESDALGNIGGVHLLLGRYRQALDSYRRSLAISEREGLKISMSQDLINLALCHLGLGEIGEALGHARRALELAREAGLRPEEAYALRVQGAAYLGEGRYDLGLAAYRSAIALYEEIGARGDQVEALGEMGSILLRLGDIASGESHFRRAARLAREIGDAQGLTRALLDLGSLEWKRGRYEEAAALALQGLERARAAKERGLEAESRIQLALTYRRQGRLDEAEVEAVQALTVSRDLEARLLASRALWSLGVIELDRRRPSQALPHFAEGLRLATATGDPDLLWRLHHGRGSALARQGLREDAVAALEAAVREIESVRGRLLEERFRSGYIEDKYQVYVDLVQLLLELDRTKEALVAAERLRARSFLGLLLQGPARASTGEEGRRELELRQRVRQLERALEQEIGGSGRRQPAVALYSRELAAAEREYQALLDDRLGREGRAALRALEIPSIEEIQRRIPADTALVEYVVSHDAVVIFVLTATRLAASTVAIAPGSLSARVELLRDLLTRTGSDLWRKPARALAEILVAPVERLGLAGIDRLVLVPHGALHYLPFAVLSRDTGNGPRLLIEDYVLSYLPSASTMLHPRPGSRTNGGLLALAPSRSRLRWASAEVRGIAELHPTGSRVLVGGEATESAFKRLAGSYRLLHLASHGRFNKLNPLRSAIELEPDGEEDGRLEVHEILGLRLQAELVTLSACETALGSGYFVELPAGDDLVGLTRSFLVAGSTSVLATLWQVDDRSTLEAMRRFYRELGNGSASDRAAALARAQRQMASAGGRTAHPHHWAAFALIGALD